MTHEMMNWRSTLLLTILSLLIGSTNLLAQPGGGGGMGGGQGGGNSGRGGGSSTSRPDPFQAIGIITHDYDEVIKKLKVSNENQQIAIYKLLGEHNSKMYLIKDQAKIHYDNIKLAIASGDMNEIGDARESYMENLQGFKEKTRVLNEELEEKIIKGLSSKQLKKWKNYIKSKNIGGQSRPSGGGQNGGRQSGSGGGPPTN